MTHKQAQALAALLTQPTKEKAAQAAGIGLTTLKRYLADPRFQKEYQKAISGLIEDAATAAKQSLDPALSCLREIVTRDGTLIVVISNSSLKYWMLISSFSEWWPPNRPPRPDHPFECPSPRRYGCAGPAVPG